MIDYGYRSVRISEIRENVDKLKKNRDGGEAGGIEIRERPEGEA